MQKVYFSKVRRMMAAMALCVVAIGASATPYKNIHVKLEANESGRGKVYIKSEDPSNLQTRKGETATMKATLGENGNDTSRVEGDALRGIYMVWLYAEPEDGYELAGFSLVKKADGEYTKADLIAPTYTDNGNFTDPYMDDDEFVFNANCPRDVDGDSQNFSGDDASDQAREYARSLNNWNEEPDHLIYAVFVPERTVLPDGEGTSNINNVQLQKSATQIYSLSGQKVTALRKGIFIINGKKVIR